MKLFLIVACVFLTQLLCVAQDVEEEWLEANAVDIRSIDPLNEDYADLEFLVSLLGDKQIILLGEESHSFATTFEAKSRLIKFLHERLGYNVLAFEIDLYTMGKVNELTKSEDEQFLPIQNYLYPFWGKTKSTNELFHYIDSIKGANNEFQYIGFDCQVIPRFDLLSDVEKLLVANESDIPSYKNFDKFKTVFQDAYARQMRDLTIEDYALLVMFVDDILIELELKESKGQHELMMTQSLVNIKQEMLNQIVNKPNQDYQMGNLNPDDSSYGFIGDQRSMGILNRRDKQMAENIKWIKEVLYPNEKVIVWAHSEHTMYDRNKVKKTFPPDFPFHLRFTYGYNYKSTGSHLKDHFGNAVYTMGFSTINGTIDYSTTQSAQYLSEILPEKGSIEEKLIGLGYKYPFIDFTKSRAYLPQGLFNDGMISNVLDGNETTGDVSHFFDGVLFIRDAKPIEYLTHTGK